MNDYFRALGEQIAARWRALGNDERAFAPLATQALQDAPPHQQVAIADVCAWLLDPERAIAQPAMNGFGQPPVVVFIGGRFRIEALFWRDSTTSIHQHSFAGAFTVLGGTSFHSVYDFAESRRVNTRLRFGALTARTHEILRPGDVRTIAPGGDFVHQVTHLDVPTVSVVVRTDGVAEHRPQLRYELPGIALDADDEDPVLARRMAMIELLGTTAPGAAIEAAHSWIRSGDPESIYHLLTQVAPHVTADELYELDVELVRRHGWIGGRIAEACHHRRRVYAAMAVRARTRNPALRLLVAALMLRVPPDQIRTVLAAHAAGGASSALDDHILELARTGVLGLDRDELTEDLVRALIRGATPETLLQTLAADYEADELTANRDAIVEQARRVCSVPLLSHLFDATSWSSQGRGMDA